MFEMWRIILVVIGKMIDCEWFPDIENNRLGNCKWYSCIHYCAPLFPCISIFIYINGTCGKAPFA